MPYKLEQMQKSLHQLQKVSQMEMYPLFPGIVLYFLTVKAARFSLCHDLSDTVFKISFCRSGLATLETTAGKVLSLRSGDICLQKMKAAANAAVTLPNEGYEGLTLCIDFAALAKNPLPLLADAGVTGELLKEKLRGYEAVAVVPGNEQTERFFSAFYDQPENLRQSYWKLKSLELLLYLSKQNTAAEAGIPEERSVSQYPAEYIETIKTIHEQITQDLQQRYTIESLARKYLLNPTTLKDVFKAVYGSSLAAHVKEHRMEQAAALLLETGSSVAEIAQIVGYESQSKFTAAFKAHFKLLPTEYRRQTNAGG